MPTGPNPSYQVVEQYFPDKAGFEAALPTWTDVANWRPGTPVTGSGGSRTRSGHATPFGAHGSRTRGGHGRALNGSGIRVRTGHARPLVAKGARTRLGSISFLQGRVVPSAGSHNRTRSGSAGVTHQFTHSATGNRSRGGYLFFTISNVGTGIPSTVNRWQLSDPVTGASYTFEINGNKGGTPTRTRVVTVVPTTAVDGTPLVFQGQEQVASMQFEGVTQTRMQYDTFKTWFAKRYAVLLVDDLGRQMQVVLEKWEPKRASTFNNHYRHTYTATYRVLSGGFS